MRVLGIVVSVGLALAAVWWLSRDLAPPKTLVFAAGSEGGGYWRLAERYRTILARDGIEVTLLATKGSVENARLLAEGQAEVGLLQGGIQADPSLEALGALFLEPLFVFVSQDASIPNNPGLWQSVRAAVGSDGSGTRAAVETMLASARLGETALILDPRGGGDAAEALLSGEVDMAVFVAPLMAPYLQPLLRSPDVRLMQIDHVEAVSRGLAQSQVTTLPSGALSLDPALPAEPIHLLTMVATLAARPGLHPSLVDRLIEAARAIHGNRDAITNTDQFPSMKGIALGPDAQAAELIETGPSPLQEYLPYWVVAQINRFAILLLPVLFLLLPIIRILPGIYAWRMRRRVFRYYGAIREIEEAAQDADSTELADLDTQLEALDAEIADLRLPLPYRDYAYSARLHVDLLRNKISEQRMGRAIQA